MDEAAVPDREVILGFLRSLLPPPLPDRRYRLAGLPGEYQLKNISSPEINYCLIGELIIWTQYEIQVAAFTAAGLGVFSPPLSEYTLQGGGTPSAAFVRNSLPLRTRPPPMPPLPQTPCLTSPPSAELRTSLTPDTPPNPILNTPPSPKPHTQHPPSANSGLHIHPLPPPAIPHSKRRPPGQG